MVKTLKLKKQDTLKACVYAVTKFEELGKHKNEYGKTFNYYCPFAPEGSSPCENPVLVSMASIMRMCGPIYQALDDAGKSYDTPEESYLNGSQGYMCQKLKFTEEELKSVMEEMMEEADSEE